MSRNRLLLLLAVGLAVGFVVSRLRPRAPIPEPPPPPRVEKPRPALQADATGHYLPGYSFPVDRLRFTGFILRPEAIVTFNRTTTGVEYPVYCDEARISADAVHLRCVDPQVGTVTVDGKFLTRLATKRPDTPVLSALVTVRTGSGEILYSARDSFVWQPED